MKIIYIYIFLVLIALETNAQNNFSTKQRYMEQNNVSVGIMAGINHSNFIYNENHLKSLPNNLFLRFNFGLFIDIPINKSVSISPTFSLCQKGTLVKYNYEQNYNITYTVKSKYFSTKIPIYYYIITKLQSHNDVRPYYNIHNDIKPFIVIAPSYNYLCGGNISLTQPNLPIEEVNINIGKANMAQHDLCIFIGGGVCMNIFLLSTKFEFGYNIGIINNYSKMEIQGTSHSNNIHAYYINGKRFNHNLEFNIHIGIPIKKTKEGCKECNKRYPQYSKSKKMIKYRKKNHKSIINFNN